MIYILIVENALIKNENLENQICKYNLKSLIYMDEKNNYNNYIFNDNNYNNFQINITFKRPIVFFYHRLKLDKIYEIKIKRNKESTFFTKK